MLVETCASSRFDDVLSWCCGGDVELVVDIRTELIRTELLGVDEDM